MQQVQNEKLENIFSHSFSLANCKEVSKKVEDFNSTTQNLKNTLLCKNGNLAVFHDSKELVINVSSPGNLSNELFFTKEKMLKTSAIKRSL